MPAAVLWFSISRPSCAPSVTSMKVPAHQGLSAQTWPRWVSSVPDTKLVEAILEPSKAIKKGYETVTIVTDDGRTISGLLAEDRADAVILRDPGQDGKPITIAKSRIEQQSNRGPSLMPAGLVNALASRQQFLDLMRYLMEIAEHGPARARALRPDPALLAPPLPDYERNLDHAGLIARLGTQSVPAWRGDLHARLRQLSRNKRASRLAADGASICLGDAQEWRRSLPHVSHAHRRLRPDGGADLDGSSAKIRRDPLHPRGVFQARQSTPVRPHRSSLPGPAPQGNEPRTRASGYRALGRDGLRAKPVGNSGSRQQWFEHRLQGNRHPARRGAGGISRGRAWVVYDHDTLRLAAAWTGQGFIDWNGINFNGRHQVHPRIVGKVHATNPDGPGWANPNNQSFADLRVRGRDGRFYGPLPRSWAHFKGLYHHGDQVILAYTVGTAEILETPGLETDPAHPDQAIFTRTLEIGPATDDLTMRVAIEGAAVSLTGDGQASLFRRDGFILLGVPRGDRHACSRY